VARCAITVEANIHATIGGQHHARSTRALVHVIAVLVT
jgi:hypothetical protein